MSQPWLGLEWGHSPMSTVLHADLRLELLTQVLWGQQSPGPGGLPAAEIKGQPDNSYKGQTSQQKEHRLRGGAGGGGVSFKLLLCPCNMQMSLW